MAVSLQELSKAIRSLNEAVNAEKTDMHRDAAIQRFEFCIELAWKTSKKMMGTNTSAPKQVIREMAQSKLIENVELWLTSIDKRNLSSHTYNEALAEEIYQFAKNFVVELESLEKELGNL